MPEVQYKSSYLNGFRFSLGMRSDTIEEVLESFDRLDLIDTFIALDITSVEKAVACQIKHIHSILESLEVLENGQKDIVGVINRIKNDFKGQYINRRLIFQTEEDSPEQIEIESGFKGNFIGLVDVQNTPSIASSPYTDEGFDAGLLRITYRQGVYYMKSNGTTNIYRRFVPKEVFSAYPGHRICLGDNILYLL